MPPGTQGGGGVEWQDPVTLANARGPSWRELVRGGSCNFKRVKGLVGRHWSLFDDFKHGGGVGLSVLVCVGLEAMEV